VQLNLQIEDNLHECKQVDIFRQLVQRTSREAWTCFDKQQHCSSVHISADTPVAKAQVGKWQVCQQHSTSVGSVHVAICSV